MKLKIGHISLFSTALLLFYANPGQNKTILAESLNKQQSYQIASAYPRDFVESYTKDCVARATDHLEIEDARKLCQCMIDRFQADYTYEQYKQLSEEAKQDLGMSCFEEIDSEG